MQMKSELFVSNINLASFSTYHIGGDARWLPLRRRPKKC